MPVLGFSIILAFLLAGELISALIGHFMPGSVIGMILLFLALTTKVIKADWIRSVSDFLTNNITILFVPSIIGIIDQWGIIRTNLITWLVIIAVCWFAVFASAGWTHQSISRLQNRRNNR